GVWESASWMGSDNLMMRLSRLENEVAIFSDIVLPGHLFKRTENVRVSLVCK
ncbi:hypothetical protein Tco_0660369, partial [Tanacetum coccineum]